MIGHVSKQVRIRVRLHALVSLTIWLAPQLVQAWADAPSCGFPSAVNASVESSEGDEETLGMCAPRTPHLLRNPTIETYGSVAGRDAPEDAPLVAARALERAHQLDDADAYEEALLNLRVVEATMPRIADHVAMMRADLHMKHSDFERAAAAYTEVVTKTPSVELRAEARVGRVRSLLRAGTKGAESELTALLERYPELPEAGSLRIELARHRELTGHVRNAISIYREIDLELPGYPMAAEARERLAALAGEGRRVVPFTELEQLERAARLIRSGPVEQARATVMALRSQPFSRAYLRQRDALIASFDEIEGRRFARTDDQGERGERDDYALLQLKKKLGRRPERQIEKLKSPQLALYLERAAAARDTAVADMLVGELARRLRSSSPELRFDALTVAAGTASDEALIALADTLLDAREVAVPARYHRARALERLGKRDDARDELRRVIQLDVSPTQFYATFAEQRLRELEGSGDGCRAAGRASSCNRAAIDTALRELEELNNIDLDRAILQLTLLESLHGAAYPWLSRALDLARVGEVERAADELYEVLLAFRLSGRRGTLRAGREAVYRGVSLNHAAVVEVGAERARLRQLDVDARMQLAEVSRALGDHGLAVNFGGLAFAEQQPLPFAGEVARAARKYGLDPDLLFAVMRVESVYQRRIVSHAGAIGLMQIMPRTGRLIAERLGRPQMTATDLLDPQTNIEFSAWYLSSLIERMDGRLPLAIASYNGGPHNVRAWIRRYGAHVPLDAFLERIPFQETKRYVRRVLGYYASYKARRGERVALMAMHLPNSDRPSDVGF